MKSGTTFRSSGRVLTAAIAASTVPFLLLASSADAGKVKNHCRRLAIQGTTGDNPNSAKFWILDKNNNTLTASCDVQPWDNEDAIDYIKRLPLRWNPTPNDPAPGPPGCPSLPLDDPTYFEDNPPPPKACIPYTIPGGPSCLIKYKVAPKTTGDKKQYVEFCCYKENAEKFCKEKLEPGVQPKPIPITVVVDTDGISTPCPPAPCDDNCPECAIVDVTSPFVAGASPILRDLSENRLGMKHLPSTAATTCRTSLGSALASYATTATAALARCHNARLAGKVDASTDCNSVNDDPATASIVDQSEAGVLAALDNACATDRSPSSLGYGACPHPCGSIATAVCFAGDVGASCERDSDCDTSPGNGRCGDWNATAECLVCLLEGAVTTAAATSYGAPAPGSPEAAKCQAAVGNALQRLVGTEIREAITCQKRADDAGKMPPGVDLCTEADPKSKVSATQSKARDGILKACSAASLVELGTTCGGTSDPAVVGDCVVANARAVERAVAFAAYPETTKGCGNGIVDGAEQCDGPADAACPGLCMSDCQCGMATPLPGALVPCNPGVIDRYVFDVRAGENVTVHADTVDLANASDLCFGPGSGCTTGDDISGDEDVPCSFPSPLEFDCPQDSFTASEDGQCTIEIAECINDCANPALATYTLVVQRDGADAPVRQTANDEPE